MKCHSLIIVAHPDDEVLWFSSIIKKPGAVLVFCFQNTPHTSGSAVLKYVQSISTILQHYTKLLPILWLQTPKTTTPKMFGRMAPRIQTVLNVNVSNLIKVIEPKKIYTHNPWGEYGHTEHIAVHKAVILAREDAFFPSAVLGSVRKRIKKFSQLYAHTQVRETNRTEFRFKQTLFRIYKSTGIWTGKDCENARSETFFSFK